MLELDDLPDGWAVKCLSDPTIATLNPKKSELNGLSLETPVTFVPMSAVDDSAGMIARPEVRSLGKVKKGYTYFAENDVIFAKITPCMENGKCAIGRGLRNGVGFGSTEFHVVRSGPETTPEWLHYLLRSQQVRDDAKNTMHGAAGQQRVPVEFLERLEIPVPPLAEQRRLVARIDAIMSLVHELVDRTRSLTQALDRTLATFYNRIIDSATYRPFGEVAKLARRAVTTTLEGQYGENGYSEFWQRYFFKTRRHWFTTRKQAGLSHPRWRPCLHECVFLGRCHRRRAIR